jgi:hypothetical protein
LDAGAVFYLLGELGWPGWVSETLRPAATTKKQADLKPGPIKTGLEARQRIKRALSLSVGHGAPGGTGHLVACNLAVAAGGLISCPLLAAISGSTKRA